jgi:hypothetical protein
MKIDAKQSGAMDWVNAMKVVGILLTLAIVVPGALGASAVLFPEAQDVARTSASAIKPLDNGDRYNMQVFTLLLKEANLVAKELHLLETLPIKESDLVERFIPPVDFAQRFGALGSAGWHDPYESSLPGRFTTWRVGTRAGPSAWMRLLARGGWLRWGPPASAPVGGFTPGCSWGITMRRG